MQQVDVERQDRDEGGGSRRAPPGCTQQAGREVAQLPDARHELRLLAAPPRPPLSLPVTDRAALIPDTRARRCRRDGRCGGWHAWRDGGSDASGRRTTAAAPDRGPAAMSRPPRRRRRGCRGLQGREARLGHRSLGFGLRPCGLRPCGFCPCGLRPRGLRPCGPRAPGGWRGGWVGREPAPVVAGVACGGQRRGCAGFAGCIGGRGGLAVLACLHLVGMALFHRESRTDHARTALRCRGDCKARALPRQPGGRVGSP
jgi:hypothetical protein